MKRNLSIFLLFSSLCWCAVFQTAKVLDVRDASAVGANTVADSSEGVTGAPSFVPAMLSRCQITLALQGTSYTAVFPVNKHLRISDFAAGDSISARIEGNKLVIKSVDGKEMKSKIMRREPVEAASQEKPAASEK